MIRRSLKNLSLLLLSILFSLLSFEAGFRAWAWMKKASRIAPPVEYDHALGYRFRKDSSGIMTVTPQGTPVRVTIDGKGYRMPAPADDDRRNRIVCLGDSLMFGYHNQDDETLPFFLSQYISSFSVINAGVPGYTSWQIVQSLEKEISDPKNRIFVVMLGCNDLSYFYRTHWTPDSVPHKNLYPLLKILQRSYFLSFVFNKAYLVFGGLGRELIPSDPGRFVSKIKGRPTLERPTGVLYSTVQRRIGVMDALAGRYNKTVVVLPIANLLENGISACEEKLLLPNMRILPINYEQYRQSLIELNRVIKGSSQTSANLIFLDINEVLGGDPACRLFSDGIHLTQSGNRLAAEFISGKLFWQTPIPSSRIVRQSSAHR
jgi:lysophospholipase L1-like esterase